MMLEGSSTGAGSGSGDGSTVVTSVEIDYAPGSTRHIKVFAPPPFDNDKTITSSSLLEGDSFDLNLTARDEYGNMAREFGALRMAVSGTGGMATV